MKYSIFGFNQQKALELQEVVTNEHNTKSKVIKVDVVDLLILQDVADFMNRKNIIKYIIDEKTYFSIKYSTIIQDLPILGIKQQALSDRLNKLCKFGLLEKQVVKNQSGSYTAFRIGEAYEDIVYNNTYDCTSSEIHLHKYSNTSAKVAEHECYNNSNNIYNNSTTINSTTNKKEDINISSKSQKNKSNNDDLYDYSNVPIEYVSIVKQWCLYKKERREKYKTQSSFDAMVKRLIKLSGGSPVVAKDIVEQSIGNNYAGLFELRKAYTNTPVGMIITESQDERMKKYEEEKGW